MSKYIKIIKLTNEMVDFKFRLFEFPKLYSMINSILFNNDIEMNMNAEPKLFDWYCEIRNNLCQQIHDKKEQLIKPQANQQKG